MFAYDPEILSLVREAPLTIDDVIGTMHGIDSLCPDIDGLKWFNWLYLGITEAVKARIEAGGFQDGAWMGALDVQFAGLYFAALRDGLSGGAAPRCWTVLLERRNWTALARIQCALAGVNAHINHDLPLALVRTGPAPVHGDAHYGDYTALNTTLGAHIDSAMVELHLRLPGDPLPAVSRLEDTLAAFSASAAREAAWNHAEVLWELRGLPELTARSVATLDGMTALVGKTLLVPVV